MTGDQGILAIVDGLSVGVGEPQIGSAGDATCNGDCRSLVIARSGALKFVDGAEFCDGSAERIDARWPGTGQRAGKLPGREGIDSVVAADENGAGGIENGVSERGGLREIYVERADQVFSTNIEQGQGHRGAAHHFLFQSQAGLLHARSDEVRGKGGNSFRDALGKSRGERAGCGIKRTTYQRIGISGEDLVVVIIRVVEEEAGVGDTVFGFDH